MILTLLCLASIWSNILCFNFALICINSEFNIADLNTTSNSTNTRELPNNDVTLFADPTIQSPKVEEKHEKQLFTSRQLLYLTSVVAASALFTNFVVVFYVSI